MAAIGIHGTSPYLQLRSKYKLKPVSRFSFQQPLIEGFASPTKCTNEKYYLKRNFKCFSAASKSPSSSARNIDFDSLALKSDLLSKTAGLDRGISADDSAAHAVETAVQAIESKKLEVRFPKDLERTHGRWRLVYSSGFLSGSFGGQRPGPPIGRLPISLGQVYQKIDTSSKQLDNIVTLQLGSPWPLPSIKLTATLAHTFETFDVNGIRIIFEKTFVKGEGLLESFPSVELLQLPDFLRPPATLRSGEFKTTYLDDDMRITRGDRGELRIFVKD